MRGSGRYQISRILENIKTCIDLKMLNGMNLNGRGVIIWRRWFEPQAQGGSLLCYACCSLENDPQKSWSGLNKSREVYFYEKNISWKNISYKYFFSAFQKVGGGENRISKRLKWVNGSKNGRFLGCFSTIRFSKTEFLAWLRSSHGVLSMIFGFLTKFKL